MINLYQLIEKYKQGVRPSEVEKEYIKTQLENPDHEDLYNVFRAAGLMLSASPENINLVEQYLSKNIDDYDLSGALAALCSENYWGLSSRYLKELIFYTRKENSDKYSETQIISFTSLGEYLNKFKDKEVYEILYNEYEDVMQEYLTDKSNYTLYNRLSSLYQVLDRGIRGQKSLVEFRVGKMKYPEDVNNETIKKIKKIITKTK